MDPVRRFICQSKGRCCKDESNKAAGLSGVVSEMLKASGEASSEWWLTCAMQLLKFV